MQVYTKACSKCKTVKEETEFYTDNSRLEGSSE